MTSINLKARLYLHQDNQIYPITTLIAEGGELTENDEEAIVVVAGRDDRWFTIDLREFEPVTTQ
jgi:hypothetical protein